MYNKTKRIASVLLVALMLAASTVPVLAIDVPTAGPRAGVIQPRYVNVDSANCTLSITGTTAKVSGVVRFIPGETCDVYITLEKNGSAINSWSTSSSNGYLSINKTVSNLKGGDYQVVMDYDCGPDSGTAYSTVKTI